VEITLVLAGCLKKINSANVFFTGGFLKYRASANVISTCGCIKKTVSANVVSAGGFLKQTANEKADLHWPLALAALKNVSVNSSRTANIELLCTSVLHQNSS
jgi:hypothetical protein